MGGSAGDTWGISGPDFLLAYIVIALVVWAVGTRARWVISARQAVGPARDLSGRPHDVAYLNRGPELAVYSALSSMHLAGTVRAARRGTVVAAGSPGPGADELERAIHLAAAEPVGPSRLRSHRQVTAALAAIESRLVAAGLLLSGERRRRIRSVGWWMTAVAALGFARLLAGIAGARPVGFLLAALAVVGAVAVFQLLRSPRRSVLGHRTLIDMRRRHQSLAPAMKPDWQTYGPAAAALGVGVFGMGALWASDPVFADELALQRASSGGYADGGGSAGSSSDGGGSGGSGGGDGGGGGGCGG
jgi:uncharacterized protein (TIGR04222 family)